MTHVCLVEDDTVIRETLTRILERMGYSVTAAMNGREGLEALDRFTFDILITDIIMPEVEGIEVIRAAKKKSPNTRIIAMSGGGRVGNTDFLKIAKTVGADQIIYKPVTKSVFLTALSECQP